MLVKATCHVPSNDVDTKQKHLMNLGRIDTIAKVKAGGI